MTDKERHWRGRLIKEWKEFGKTDQGQRLRRELKAHNSLLYHSHLGNNTIPYNTLGL